MTAMTDQDDAIDPAISWACERLTTRYAHLVDEGQASGVVDLFTDDAVWSAPGIEMVGRDQLLAGFGARNESSLVSRHVCTNFALTRCSPDEAEGIVYLTLYRRPRQDGEGAPLAIGGPTMIGVYRDRYVRTDDGWRFAERRCDIDFVRGPA